MTFFDTLHHRPFRPIVDVTKKLVEIDLSQHNPMLTDDDIRDMTSLRNFINRQILQASAHFGVGGYGESRKIYQNSILFNGDGSEPRRIHLGVDIWGPANTPVYCPADGLVHSFANNEGYGNYGCTLVLRHCIDQFTFHTLYGHITQSDITNIEINAPVSAGEVIAHFGNEEENGQWPPHLHFQIILDMGLYHGDYPGVCRASEMAYFLANCPDPETILKMRKRLVEK